jgi:hypothetical protein
MQEKFEQLYLPDGNTGRVCYFNVDVRDEQPMTYLGTALEYQDVALVEDQNGFAKLIARKYMRFEQQKSTP